MQSEGEGSRREREASLEGGLETGHPSTLRVCEPSLQTAPLGRARRACDGPSEAARGPAYRRPRRLGGSAIWRRPRDPGGRLKRGSTHIRFFVRRCARPRAV